MILDFIRNRLNLYKLALIVYGIVQQKSVKFHGEKIEITNSGSVIRLSIKNISFAREIIDFFDFYFNSVESFNGCCDFSEPKLHTVASFEYKQFWFPSTSEPMSTLNQYQEILQIEPDEIVIDLGSYSAFSSIYFQTLCKNRVISVEADPINIKYCRKNIELHKGLTSNLVSLYPYAISNANGSQKFISDGTMASKLIDARDVIGILNNICVVETRTLSQLVTDTNLERVDVLKADIEGAEFIAFQDSNFFNRFKPRILLEPINSNEAAKIKNLLLQYGYSKFAYYKQNGSKQDLMLCQK